MGVVVQRFDGAGWRRVPECGVDGVSWVDAGVLLRLYGSCGRRARVLPVWV